MKQVVCRALVMLLVVSGSSSVAAAQDPVNVDSLTAVRDSLAAVKDSLFIAETEERPGPAKILHAEPLFIDLLRDLGARKGEREWNVGVALTDRTDFDTYDMFVEYEWAPINRLGLEIEVPFSFPSANGTGAATPSARVEGLKTGVQWTAVVSPKAQTSVAFAYLNTVKFTDLRDVGNEPLIRGNIFNPFVVAAKRWGANLHTLIYTGPSYERKFRERSGTWRYAWNSNVHYMLPGTRSFIGLEVNKEVASGSFDMVLRPQMRLEVNDHLLVGIVPGIPINRSSERLSTFLRLIYEPGRRGSRAGAPH
jgi:hypothetical protein